MASSHDVMQTNLGTGGALYVYNGPSKLQELERVNLTGARVIFNGAYDLGDLRRVNFTGAIVFVNGQERTPDSGTAFIDTTHSRKPSSPLRRHKIYDPHEGLRRSSRQRRRSEKASATSESANSMTHENDVRHGQHRGICPNEDVNVRKIPNTLVQWPPKPPIFRQSTGSKLTTVTNGRRSPTNIQVVSHGVTAIANEGHQLDLRKSDLSDAISSSQEGAKVTMLFPEMPHLKEQLHQQLIGAILPEVKPSRSNHGGPELQLPKQSPLHSIITFAKVEEDIIQAKVEYKLAQKVWRRECQTQGQASEHISQRLKRVGELLTDLYEKREAAFSNRDRTRAYRDIKQEGYEANGEGATSKEVLRELPLRQVCEEYGPVKFSRYQEGTKMILPSTVDKDDTNQPPPCRRVRFALTDTETFIEP